MDLVEVLSFLFMLSTMELGRVRHPCRLLVLLTLADTIPTARNIPRTH